MKIWMFAVFVSLHSGRIFLKIILKLMSHDAHFILHYLLLVAIRSTMPHEVADPLIRFGAFFSPYVKRLYSWKIWITWKKK